MNDDTIQKNNKSFGCCEYQRVADRYDAALVKKLRPQLPMQTMEITWAKSLFFHTGLGTPAMARWCRRCIRILAQLAKKHPNRSCRCTTIKIGFSDSTPHVHFRNHKTIVSSSVHSSHNKPAMMRQLHRKVEDSAKWKAAGANVTAPLWELSPFLLEFFQFVL